MLGRVSPRLKSFFLERFEMKMKLGRLNQSDQIELFVIGVNEMLI